MDKRKRKIEESDREALFFKMLNGSSISTLSSEYNVSTVTVRNIFWRTMYKVMYLSNHITFDAFYQRACNKTSAKSGDLEEVRSNAEYWLSQYVMHKCHKVGVNSKLMHLDIATTTMKALTKYGVQTVEGYLMHKDKIKIGRVSTGIIEKHLENICLNK